MKHRMIITLLLSLLAVAAVVVWRMAPRLFPAEASDLYRRYEHCEHIRVADIRDFQVNDTLTVDVTILQATDSTGWESLKKDFFKVPLHKSAQEKVAQGMDIVSIHLARKADPTQPMDTSDLLNNNVIAVSCLHQTVSVFYTETVQEMNLVSQSQWNKGLKKK